MRFVRENLSRWVFLASALVLCLMGLAYNWLIRGDMLLSAALQTLLPVAAAASFFLMQCRFHFLESILHAVRSRKMLTLILIFGMTWLLNLGFGKDLELGSLLVPCFCLCVCLCDGAYLDQNAYLLLILSSFLLCFSMAASVGDLGLLVTMGVLGVLVYWHSVFLYQQEEDFWFDLLKMLLVFTAAALCSHSLVCWHHVSEAVQEGSWLSEEVSYGCWVLGKEINGICSEQYYEQYIQILKLYCIPGYLYVVHGAWAAVPVVAALVVFLLSGQRLCSHSCRIPSMLTLCCVCLLSLRIVNLFLLVFGWDMGIYDGIPFFSGFWNNLLDCMLTALAAAPMVPVKDVLRLDPEDTNYAAQELVSLRRLPRNEDGLAKLNRHVFNFNNRPEAWKLLFTDYLPLLQKDVNTLRIMVLNGQENYDPTLRSRYPLFFQYAEDPVHTQVPEEMATCCPDNSYLDTADAYRADEWYLHRYEGHKKTLLIPPFYVGIDRETFRCNDRLEAVSIPSTVRFIEDMAFRDCAKLHHVELRPGLEAIGKEAFMGTALKKLVLPDTVTEVDSGAFRDCQQLQEVTIPDSLEKVSPDAFEGCVAIRKIHCSDSWRQTHKELWENITLWADIPREEV